MSNEEKKEFVNLYSESSNWKENDDKLIKSIAHQLNSNITIIDPKFNLPIIEKVSNTPDTNIVLARENNKYFSWFREEINETKLNKEILNTPVNKEISDKFKKVINIEDVRVEADPIIKKMEKKQYKLSQEKKLEELKTIKKKFKKFKENSVNGVTSNNPVHSTNQGIAQAEKGNHGAAIERFKNAIKQDKIFSVPARYNMPMSLIEQHKDLHGHQKDEAIKSLEKATSIIDNKLIPQIKSSLFQYMIKVGPENFSEQEKSSMSKQIGSKINVLETVKLNIKENLDVIRNFNKDTHEIKIADSKSLSSLFTDHKDEKESAVEYERAGLPNLKKVVAVEKPKKKKGCGGIGMILLGVVQIVAGAFLTVGSFGLLATTIGRTLITSGISDVFTGVSSLITGKPIDWKQWGLDKVGMIGVSLFSFGMSKISSIISSSAPNSIRGAIFKNMHEFFSGKGQHLLNAGLAAIQNNKKENKADFEKEARKEIDQKINIVKKECSDFIDNANLNGLKENEEQYSRNFRKIIKYIKNTLNSKATISKEVIKRINQMIVSDKGINKN